MKTCNQQQFYTGAILIGGKSSRMGEPKHLMRLPNGKRMIDVVYETLSTVCCDVVIVGAADGVDGLTQIEDLRADTGPLGGIEALLASGVDSQYLVCPCDVPLISPELLRRLTMQTGSLATVFHIYGEDCAESLPARLSAEALPTVRMLLHQDERALWRLMKELSVDIVELSSDEARQLHNVNTPSSFLAAQQEIADRQQTSMHPA